jgi:hypothetical protein
MGTRIRDGNEATQGPLYGGMPQKLCELDVERPISYFESTLEQD